MQITPRLYGEVWSTAFGTCDAGVKWTSRAVRGVYKVLQGRHFQDEPYHYVRACNPPLLRCHVFLMYRKYRIIFFDVECAAYNPAATTRHHTDYFNTEETCW